MKTQILFKDFSHISPITESVREKNAKRTFTGGVRINQSMYRTAKEDADYREKSLKRKLP